MDILEDRNDADKIALAVHELCLSVPEEVLKKVAAALAVETERDTLKDLDLGPDAAARIEDLLNMCFPRMALLAALHTGLLMLRERESVRSSLSWSGPLAASSGSSPERMLLDLVNGAQKELLLAGFSFCPPFLEEALNKALERGVRIRLVMETRLDPPRAVIRHASAIRKKLPGALLFYWPLEKRPPDGTGLPVLSAACAASEKGFLLGAGLSGAGACAGTEPLTGLTGKEKAREVLAHFDSLIEAGELVPPPGSSR